jgi:hypothetical protein
VAAAAVSFSGKLYLFLTNAAGTVAYARGDSATELGNWKTLDHMSSQQPPSVCKSNRKLFVFTVDKTDERIYYRILDLSHGRQDWLPSDIWMPLGSIKGKFRLASAVRQDRIFVFFSVIQPTQTVLNKGGVPMPKKVIFQKSPLIYMVTGQWSRIPVVVLRGGDNPLTTDMIVVCPNAADLTGFDIFMKFANSVYAPGLRS